MVLITPVVASLLLGKEEVADAVHDDNSLCGLGSFGVVSKTLRRG
jgi:hypothetical protein